MKVKTYLRIAKTSRGYKVVANSKPNSAPIEEPSYFRNSRKAFPTVAFRVDFNVPDEAFETAQKCIAEVNVPAENVEIAMDMPKAAPATETEL